MCLLVYDPIALEGLGFLIVEVSRSSERVIGPSQKHLPDNTHTQHSQETDIHASGGIRNGNPSKRAAVDPRPRPRGHWDWGYTVLLAFIVTG
jgi:hypothetical protein